MGSPNRSDSSGVPDGPPPRSEAALRAALGIPASATEVVVVAESTHWDPNWLVDSGRYYRWCVRPTLEAVIDALEREPRRVFSLECMFFVDRYWRDRPDRRERFRSLVNDGRLHFTGAGVTTPDTLLPEDELILRDLLVGQEWLRNREMNQEPRLLYLPDSFGHSPGLPALARAAGVDRIAVCRIAGMRFPGADLERAANFPRPDTSAAQLLESRTADFVWRAPDGSEALTHWMAHGYGQGDMIASGGLSRALGLPVSWPDRRPAHVDHRVERYLDQLRAVALTPYRLLPIGFDFVRPIPRLVELLDDWNDRNHTRTGTWLVNGTIDDYLDLVDHHRDRLPTITLDPNPYWMGFYASRPEIKAAARDLGRRLIARDVMEVVSPPRADRAGESAEPDQWWIAVTSNHHDFVTGTAPDRVAHGEQRRWLDDAITRAPWPAVRSVPAPAGSSGSTGGAPRATAPPLEVERRGPTVTLLGKWGSITFDPTLGGAAVSATDEDGAELLDSPSLVVASYRDSGGLWRMGQEINGGRWSRADRSDRGRAEVDVRLLDGGAAAEVVVVTRCDGRDVRLWHSFRAEDRVVLTRSATHPRLRRTMTLAIAPRGPADSVTMHQPGAVLRRPLTRWYEPTFWPLHSFAFTNTAPVTKSSESSLRLACAVASPTALHVDSDGGVEVVVARAPFKELAFGVVPVMAPAWGWRCGDQDTTVAWTLLPDRQDDLHDIRTGRMLWGLADSAVGRPAVDWPITTDDPDVEVIAVKPASRGTGVIVGLRDWGVAGDGPGPRPARPPRKVRLLLSDRLGTPASAWLTDSRERDVEPLDREGPVITVDLPGHLTVIRINFTLPLTAPQS